MIFSKRGAVQEWLVKEWLEHLTPEVRVPLGPKLEHSHCEWVPGYRFGMFNNERIGLGTAVHMSEPKTRLGSNTPLSPLRERLRTHKVFTKDQCFNLNYH